jgi:hypothetical protein
MRALLALLLLCLPVCAQVNVTLAWDADSDPDVASYIVSSGTFVDFTTENEITLELETGVYPFEVVAVDTRGNESFPALLTVKCFRLVRERSTDQTNWTEYGAEIIATGEPNEFFRIRISEP